MSDFAFHPELPAAVTSAVVLLPRGRSMPAKAWDKIASRCGRTVVVHHEANVMVELHRGATAVIVPDDADQHTQLAQAIATYHPEVTQHAYALGAGPAPLKIAGSSRGQQDEASSPPTHPTQDQVAAMLTEEELAMLMGPLTEN
ncbi:MAG: hypothetical protein WD768_21715 [Phycisphaeraceae bacterium]